MSFFEWLQGTALALAISETWFPLVESLHVLTMAIVTGMIFIVDTRLIGFTSMKLPFTYVSERLLPWTWAAFACSVVTGTLMFMANAIAYVTNVPFRVKMVLLVLAGANMLYFQGVTFRGVSLWDTSSPPPPAARVAGFVSLGLWCAVIGFGRWIGFSI